MQQQMSSGEDDYIRLPTFREQEIEAKYTNLRQWFARVENKRVPAHLANDVASAVSRILFKSSDLKAVVRKSMDDVLQARVVTPAILDRCCWRLAANIDRLQYGYATPWQPTSLSPYWAVFEVVHVEPEQAPKRGYVLTFKLLSGPLAGRTINKIYQTRTSAAVYRRLVGRVKGARYTTPLSLFGLRGAVEVGFEAEQVSDKAISVSKSQRTKNTAVVKQRFRRYQKCIFNLPIDCDMCVIGRNECGRSILPLYTDKLKDLKHVSRPEDPR